MGEQGGALSGKELRDRILDLTSVKLPEMHAGVQDHDWWEFRQRSLEQLVQDFEHRECKLRDVEVRAFPRLGIFSACLGDSGQNQRSL